MELNELLEIDGNITPVFDSMLCNDPRSETLKRSEGDFVSFNKGFEVVCKERTIRFLTQFKLLLGLREVQFLAAV